MRHIAILVTGSRDALSTEWAIVFRRALLGESEAHDNTIIIHGDARGADRGVAAAARLVLPNTRIEAYPADWDGQGKAAGPRRNERMLARLIALRDDGYQCRVLAFHDDMNLGKGTRHMVGLALDAGFEVIHYMSDGSRRRRVKQPA